MRQKRNKIRPIFDWVETLITVERVMVILLNLGAWLLLTLSSSELLKLDSAVDSKTRNPSIDVV